MPLRGEDEPNPAQWVRDQAAAHEASGGAWWERAVGVRPDDADDQTTTDRTIPVVLIERMT